MVHGAIFEKPPLLHTRPLRSPTAGLLVKVTLWRRQAACSQGFPPAGHRSLCRQLMASAPSASALSAVLRCRGTIWKQNSQSTRPAVRVYGSLGAGRTSVPARADLLLFLRRGEQGSPGRRRVTLAFTTHQDHVKNAAGGKSRELAVLRHSRVVQSSGRAHFVVHRELVRRLAHGVFSFLPSWTDTFGGVVRTVVHRVPSSSPWEVAVARNLGSLSQGALKVSLASHEWGEIGGHAQCLTASSWEKVKKACLSLTALVSEVMCSSLSLLFCSSSSKPAQLDGQQSEECDHQVDTEKKCGSLQ